MILAKKIKSSGQVYPDFLSQYMIDSDEEYVPEYIINENGKGTKLEYLVKFLGYSEIESQWWSKKKLQGHQNYQDILDVWAIEKSCKPRKLIRLKKLSDEVDDDNNTSTFTNKQLFMNCSGQQFLKQQTKSEITIIQNTELIDESNTYSNNSEIDKLKNNNTRLLVYFILIKDQVKKGKLEQRTQFLAQIDQRQFYSFKQQGRKNLKQQQLETNLND